MAITKQTSINVRTDWTLRKAIYKQAREAQVKPSQWVRAALVDAVVRGISFQTLKEAANGR